MKKQSITFYAILCTLMAALPASARFSQFVCISPDNPDPQSKIQPVLTFTSSKKDCVAVTVPVISGDRKYWLIICREPLSADKQNFREVVQGFRGISEPLVKKREDVVLIAPLTADRGVLTEAGGTTNSTSITIQMSLELAERAYIYVDYPYMGTDGGYFWAIDIPSFVKRLEAQPAVTQDTAEVTGVLAAVRSVRERRSEFELPRAPQVNVVDVREAHARP